MKGTQRLGILALSGFSVVWLVGCSKPAPAISRGRVEAERRVESLAPIVSRIDRDISQSNNPPSADADHAVSADGMTMFFRPPSSGSSAGIILDSLGTLVTEFGRFGSGPDEFRFPVRMLFHDSGNALVFDAGLFRVTTLDSRGRTIHSSPIQTSGLPIAIVGDSLDFAEVLGRQFSVFRWSGDGHKRVIVNEKTPAVVAERGFSVLSPRGRPVVPVFGSDGSRVAVGDPWTYTVLVFREDGTLDARIHRDLPIPHRTERQVLTAVGNIGRWRGPTGEQLDHKAAVAQASAEELPYFSHVSPFGFDAGHRLWIVGSEGDSVFADVFAGSKLLARLGLPCFDFSGRWSIHGQWLSLACGASRLHDDFPEPTLQLYRIR